MHVPKDVKTKLKRGNIHTKLIKGDDFGDALVDCTGDDGARNGRSIGGYNDGIVSVFVSRGDEENDGIVGVFVSRGDEKDDNFGDALVDCIGDNERNGSLSLEGDSIPKLNPNFGTEDISSEVEDLGYNSPSTDVCDDDFSGSAAISEEVPEVPVKENGT